MLNKLAGLLLYAWNATTGQRERVEKTNDSRNALKVEDQHDSDWSQLIGNLTARSNQIHSSQIPSTTLTATEEFIGSEWLDTAYMGHFIFLIAGLADFDTVEIQWSTDGSTHNAGETAIEVLEIESDGLLFKVHLTILNVFTTARYARIRIVNGASVQSGQVGICSSGLHPYMPLIGLEDELTLIQEAILTRTVLAGRRDDGAFDNVGIDSAGRLRVMEKSHTTQSMSKFTESIRDDAKSIFSRDAGVQAVADLVDEQSVNGTVFHDPSEGQVVFSTGPDAGNTIYCHDPLTALYEAGHTIRGEQTIELSRLPVGNDDVRWGFGESDGSGDILNGIGWGFDADGLYVWRRKNGTDELITHAVEAAGDTATGGFNRDALAGGKNSRFYTIAGTVALDILKGTIFLQQFEWLGKAPPDFMIMTPYGEFIPAHREEFPNSAAGTTVPEPNMALFVRAVNASGTLLEVRSGSWRAGLYTSRLGMVAKKSDGTFGDVRMDDEGSVHTHITSIDPNFDLDGLPNNDCNQTVVGPNPVSYDTQLPDCRALKIAQENSEVSLFYGFVPDITPTFKSCLVKNGEAAFDWTGGRIYLVTGGTGGTNDQELSGTTASGTATTPSNALVSNDSYAVIDANSETVEVDGFSFSFSGANDAIQSVRIGMEVAKEAGQFDPVTFHEAETGIAGNVSAVSATQITGNPDHLYVIAVSWRNTSATIQDITNTGDDMAWIQVAAPVINTDCVTAMYYNTQPPSQDFTVTANFSGAATNSVIAVAHFSNVDLSNPIFGAESASFSGASYSDSIPDIAFGNLVVAAGVGRRDHTAGSGSNERAEPFTGSGPNDASVALTTRQLVSTGTAAYSGTLTGSIASGYLAAVLNPRDASDPVVLLSYEISSNPGVTSEEHAITSESDTDYTTDVTSDREWAVGDISALKVIATGQDIGNASALADHLFVEVTEAQTGAITRVYLHELGGDDA